MKYALPVTLFAFSLASGLISSDSLFGNLDTASPAWADTTAQDANAAPEVIEVMGAAKLTIPENWQRIRPASTMIEHEYQIKQGEGDEASVARVTMMAAGGDIKANIDRWKGQISGGDPAKQKSEEKKYGDWTAHIVDLSGSYRETMGGPFSGGRTVERKNYAMLGLILVNQAGQKYFIKITGPADLLQANREATVRMLDSLQE